MLKFLVTEKAPEWAFSLLKALLFSAVLMSPERGCEAPQLVVAAGPDGGHGRRGGEQGQVPHQPADRYY